MAVMSSCFECHLLRLKDAWFSRSHRPGRGKPYVLAIRSSATRRSFPSPICPTNCEPGSSNRSCGAEPCTWLHLGMELPFDDDAVGPMKSNRLGNIPPSFWLPWVDCYSDTRPSQSAKSRALRKLSGSGERVAMAVAISGPIPSIVTKRRATSFFLARRRISVSSSPISAFNC